MNIDPPQRPTIAEIDLDALAFNYHSIRRFIGDHVEIMAVVKADAYGHGAVPIANRLQNEGVSWFAVALVEEAIELRQAGIFGRILCLGGVWPGQERDAVNYDLDVVLFRQDDVALLSDAAKRVEVTARAHLKVDTGMGRIGVRVDELPHFLTTVKDYSNISIEGLMTHFASADDPAENSFTEKQMRAFTQALDELHRQGIRPTLVDMANSPGAILHPQARGSVVRIGGLLYGLGDDVIPRDAVQPELRPVMSLKSRVASVKRIQKGDSVGYGRTFIADRDTIIAAVPIGYHDGYRRALSNKAQAVVHNRRVNVIGTISMDWIVLDITDIGTVSVGDEVFLIGGSGPERVTAAELASKVSTISYEITCGIGSRVSRIYLNTSII